MNYWYLMLFSTTLMYSAPALLHNRTVQRNAKQQLDELLAEIGATSVEEAKQKINQLPELLKMLNVTTVSETFGVLHDRGTQNQIATLLRETGTSSVAGLITQVKGLPELLGLFEAPTITDLIKKKARPMMNEIQTLKKQNQQLKTARANLINQCKRIEKEFSTIKTLY